MMVKSVAVTTTLTFCYYCFVVAAVAVSSFSFVRTSTLAVVAQRKTYHLHHGPTSSSRTSSTTSKSYNPRIKRLYSSSSGTTVNDGAPGTSTTTLDYNWKEQWYALTFASYVPSPSESAEVVPASVFGHPLVLWRAGSKNKKEDKDSDNIIFCADDVCPHRAAALSEGRLRDGGILECYYHGWQFNGDQNGECVKIPQLSSGKSNNKAGAAAATIPKRACLRMRECRVVEGIVWVWMGDDGPATKDPPRQNHGLDEITGQREGCILNDFQIDLPYDHSYLVENLIDPAHIPISHDRTPGGGKRENAAPYEMEVDEGSISGEGFTGRYRVEGKGKDAPWVEVRFDAPGVVRQIGTNPKIIFGAALHCMPLALGRSRLLFRAYFGGLPWFANLIINSKPKFLRDLNSCKILEQDVGLITTQEDHFARNPNRSLKDDFLLLGSSDALVGAYRQWVDKVGHGMPWFQGLASRSANVNNHLSGEELPPSLNPANHRASGQDNVETRYHRHVIHCPGTRKALERVQLLKRISAVGSIASATAGAALTPSLSIVPKALLQLKLFRSLAVFSFPVLAVAYFALQRLEKSFFVSFKRKNQLRKENGMLP